MTRTATRTPLGRCGEELRDMDSGGSVRIPWPEEPTFAEQLELLDRQLADWSRAVLQAQQALRQVAAAAPSDSVAVEDPGAGTAFTLSLAANSAGIGAAPVSVESGLDESMRQPSAGEPPMPTLAVHTNSGQQTDADRGADAVDGRQPLNGGATPAPGPDDDADRALLDSLDRDTLYWIRVRQRISPQPRSVRELLEELEANKRKKRWRPGR